MASPNGCYDTPAKSDILAELIEQVGRIAQEYTRINVREFNALLGDFAPAVWDLYKGSCEDYGTARLKEDYPELRKAILQFSSRLRFA